MIQLPYWCKSILKTAYNKKHLFGSQVTITNVSSVKLAAAKLPGGKPANVVSVSAEIAKNTTKPAVDKIERYNDLRQQITTR